MVANAVPVPVVVTLKTSSRFAGQVINACSLMINGKRKNDDGAPQDSPSVVAWANTFLLKGVRANDAKDLIGPAVHLLDDDFRDEDHVAAIKVLQTTPVNKYGKVYLPLKGFAGSGKTTFIAACVAARLAGCPDTRVLIVAVSNFAVDVIIDKVNMYLDEFRSDPIYGENLSGVKAIRCHSDGTEMQYIISLADAIGKKNRPANTDNTSDSSDSDASSDDGEGGALAAVSNDQKVTSVDSPFGDKEELSASIVNAITESSPSYQSESESHFDDEYEDGATKGIKARKARELEEARLQTYEDYNKSDDKANPLSLNDLLGTNNTLKFFHAPDGFNRIVLDHPYITDGMRTDLALDVVNSFNRQFSNPLENVKVKDRRVKDIDSSAINNAIVFGEMEKDYGDWSSAFHRVSSGTEKLCLEDQFKASTKALLRDSKLQAKVLGMSINAATFSSARTQEFDIVIIDESSQLDHGGMLVLPTNVQFDSVIAVGDNNQLGPFGSIQFKGCGLVYAEKKRSSDVKIGLASVLWWSTKRCPMRQVTKCTSWHSRDEDGFERYISRVADEPIPVSLRGAFGVTLAEKFIIDHGIHGKDLTIVTHYAVQTRVYAYAFSRLHQDYPELSFNEIELHTTNSLQGSDRTYEIVDTVRTRELGFTADHSRNPVSLTRARDYPIVIGNPRQLKHPRKPVIQLLFEEAGDLNAMVTLNRHTKSYMMGHKYVQASQNVGEGREHRDDQKSRYSYGR
ncbi:hypothetical protein DSL72_001521 [Monilinia vaccinii-corymbosi]|uniref:DNA2/NAM7 helicase-like C-terminal domain-containing protein n=1 Tax=Monilinia vaccinii-corymbosi TaxID=61207 RepID=A0A8A3P423_9HELO|nr:hypothetical protein DSL72_001521 [Monilinia vaccinii-corymbosi]